MSVDAFTTPAGEVVDRLFDVCLDITVDDGDPFAVPGETSVDDVAAYIAHRCTHDERLIITHVIDRLVEAVRSAR